MIFILSNLMHFLYNLSGKNIAIALISPVNESLWEHLKLPLLPTFIWWMISYSIIKKRYIISFLKWLFSSIISYFLCVIFIIIFYYTFTGILGIQSVFLDIVGLLIGIIIGQLIAGKIYREMLIKPIYYYLAFSAYVILIFLFIVFTSNPPQIPLFKDLSTGKYGLK